MRREKGDKHSEPSSGTNGLFHGIASSERAPTNLVEHKTRSVDQKPNGISKERVSDSRGSFKFC